MAKRAHVPRPAGTPRRFERVVKYHDVYNIPRHTILLMLFFSFVSGLCSIWVLGPMREFDIFFSGFCGALFVVMFAGWLADYNAREIYYIEVRE